jgi:hypothetical protein
LNIVRAVFLAAVLLAALASAAIDLAERLKQWQPGGQSEDAVRNWEKRIAPLEADLPKRGKIGYLSEWDLEGWSGGQSDMDNEYRLTQYALAPLLLVRGHDYAQIVVNLSSEEDVQRMEEQYGVRMVHTYGFGIYLFAGPGQ